MKTTFRLLLLFVVMVAAGGKVWGEIRTITITVDSIKNGGGTLGSNSYNNEEETWIQDGVFFGGKAIAAGNGGNTGAIQMQASNGVLYNTTPLPGKIISIELHSINTPRSSSCYGGTSRLVTGTAADYSVTGGAQVGSASETGWTADDFSGTEYLFFAIKRGGNTAGNTAYLSSIVITCDVPPPSVSLSPSALAFGTILVGTTKTLKLNIKGARLTQDIAVSTATDTASVFSIPVATATAAEAMSSSGKSVDVVFTPEHTYSYGGVLKISSADFADTTLVMTGAGAMPTLNVDSSQVRFGKLAVGNSVSKTIRISSVLLTDSISVSFADNASEFFSVAASKLAPNRAATVAITYAPAAAGEHTATLHLQSGLLTKDIPLSGSAASLLLEENFAYGTGQKLTDNGWAAHSGAGTSPILVTSGLAFSEYAASSTGGAAAVVNNGEDVNRKFDCEAVTSGKIYMAFLFKTERTNNQGYFMYFAQVSSSGAISSTSLCSRLYVSSNGEQIGISESNTAPESTGAWLTVTPEITHLGVVEFDFATKMSNLYVFSEFPATQPSSGYVTSAAAATVTNVGAVALRQYDARQRIIVDGIRIATTWNEAVKEVPFPPAFVERPSADIALVTATTADIKMKLSARAKLYYTVKTASTSNVTANDIISDAAKDSAAVGATEQTLSLSRLTAATKYYVYFTAQNAYGFSEIDSVAFTTPTTMVANPGFERWTEASPAAWTLTGSSAAKETSQVKGGENALKVVATATNSISQRVYGVEAGKTYTISFWYYIETLSTSGIRIWSNFYKGAAAITPDDILHPTAYQKATGEWTQFVIEDYTAPDSANSFNFEVRIMNGVTAYFDDFNFVEVAAGAPNIRVTPGNLAFGTVHVGIPDTLKLNIKGAHLTQSIAVSIATDTASVFSIPVATVTAAEAMSSSGKSVDVIFTPEHTYSYGGVLKISSADFADTTLVLTGAGAVPTLSADSSQVRFGKLVMENSVSKTIRISSVLLTDSISVSFADNASEFFSVAVSKLAPNRAATVAITYAPIAAGEHTATLRLQSGVLTKDIPLSGSAASLLLEENFAYGMGQKLTDNGWAAHSGAGTSPILVASGLSFSEYLASGTGGAAAIVNNGEDVNRHFDSEAVTSGKIYMAFLFKTERTNNQGYFMYLAQISSNGNISSSCSCLYVSSNGERIGISESGTAPDVAGAWLTVTPEVTHLGVVEFDFITKMSNLYVFSEFPAAQPGSGYVTSAAAATVTNVGAVALRQYDARQRIIVDGIRIATTWNEAVKETAFPPAFVERPAADTALVTATTADIKMKLSARAKLYYTVKTAPVADITANDIIADAAKDSAAVGATEQTLSLSRLTAATKYYVYFTAQNAYGFSEIDSVIFTTPTTMVANPGFERWTEVAPAAWTVTDSYAKDTETVKNGKSSIKITATSDRVDMKQTIRGVEAGKTYAISFWYYIETLNTSGIRIWSNFYKGAAVITPDDILHPTAYQKATGEWTQFVIEDYTAPDSANSFNFEVRIMNGVTAYFDDFNFVEVAAGAPNIRVTPGNLAFGTVHVGIPDTLKLNIKGAHLTQSIAVSIATDTASVFSIPVATATAAEAMSSSGKSVDVVFTPEHTYSYGGVLKISSADFADTTFTLTGAGAVPTLNVDSSQVRFGKLAVENSVSKTIRISSVLLTDSISVSFADNASEFFSVAVSKLAPNRAATVAITYAPIAAGEHTATLHLQSGVLTKDIPLSGSAASLLLEENFAYGMGQKLTDNGWAAHSGAGTSPILVTSGLSFSEYVASGTGGAAAIVNNGEDVNRHFDSEAVTSGKIYMAFLFKTERTNREGYFMYLAQVSSSGAISSTSLCSRLYVSSNGEQIGISESNTAPESTGAWLTVTPEVTQLGVVEFDFTTKKSNLYVFSEFPAAQPSSGYVTSAAAATVTNVGAVALRQYDARQRIIVDGIRIATTWNEAVKEVPFPPAFVERPAADTVLVTATTADIKMKLSARAKLYYTVKTAPVADITANDIIADAAKDSVTVGATEQTLSLSRLTAATKYYVYFTAQNAYGFSEIDSAIFTTPTIMVANPGFERWTGASPAAWTVTDSYAKDTETVKNGKSSIKITATSGRVDMKQAIHGVVAGKTYTISFWYYIETLNTTTGIRIYSNFYNGATPIVSDEILHPTAYQKATGEWRQFVIRGYTAPDSANSFNFEVRIMSGVTACFDDFYFAEGDKPAPSISVTPDSLSFSAMLGGSISQSVQVTTVDISENLVVSIGGSSISCFIVPATLKSGVDTLTVTYIPDEVGSHSATLTVAGGGASCKIPLAGAVNELPPSIAITPVGSICTGADTSPYNGQKVTVAGIVTAITKDKNFFVQSGSGAQSGIYVYRRGNLVRVGDSVLVTGWVSESHKLTEIAVTNDADITVASSMHALPAPTPVTVSRMSKVYHGVLLSLDSVEVAAHATDADKYVIGSGDTTLVVAQNIATTQPAAGAVVNIIGVGFCDDDVHQLLPRSVDDVKIVKDASPATAVPKPDERSVAIYPNPADDLLHIKSAYDVAKVEVYMLSGIAVLREEAVSFVNMATLKSGIYIVRVAFVNGSSIAKIIVKR